MKLIDKIGMSASTACAIHCALTPLVLSILPSIGLAWLSSSMFGKSMFFITALIAISAITMGFKKHNRCWPIGFLGVGLTLLFLSEFFLHSAHNCDVNPTWARLYPNVKQVQHSHYVPYTVSFIGGMMIALSHVLNSYFHKTCHVGKEHSGECCHSH